MAIDVRQKTDQVIATLDLPEVLEQIKESLPENVTLTRFVRIAKTAIRSNPKLVNADQNTLFASIVKCAQSGLYPDGKEAALVIYGDKVSFLPMIDGAAKTLGEFGWLLRTGVVYDADEFEWSEEPQSITHRPTRPGVDRGQLIYAYAIATHRDGRRLQRVLNQEDVAKRRAKAQTQAIWNEWPEAMWRKSAGHAVARNVPLSERDRAQLDSVLADTAFDDPVAALYGPEGQILRAGPEPPTDDAELDKEAKEDVQASVPVDGAKLEAAAQPHSPAAASPDPDEEEAVWEVAPTEEEIDAAGAIVVPKGVHKGSTLAQVAATDGADTWFLTQLKNIPDGEPVKASFETFVSARLPEVWERYEAHCVEQS